MADHQRPVKRARLYDSQTETVSSEDQNTGKVDKVKRIPILLLRKPRADIHFPFLFSVFIFHFPISTFEKRGKIG